MSTTQSTEKKYLVKEIFGPTLQGEGSRFGEAVVFLRLSGCNRWSGRQEDKASSQCPFCDTDFLGGDRMTAEEIADKLNSLKTSCTKLVISGGEPTLQLDENLASTLWNRGWDISIETNGSRKIDGKVRQYIQHITVSPKQPLEETALDEVDDVKILYPPIHPEITPEAFNSYKARNRFLQPVMDSNYEENLAATISSIQKKYCSWRLSLQQHKILNLK